MSSFISLNYGEQISIDVIAKDLQDLATSLFEKKLSVYTLLQNGSYKQTRKPNAVLVTIYKTHAVVLIIPARLCTKIFGLHPVVGAQADMNRVDAESTVLYREETILMYHVHLTNHYKLGKKLYTSASTRSFDWGNAPKPYYFGHTKLPEQLLDVLALLCLHDFKLKYRLTSQDCVEFAKKFASVIAKQENGSTDDQLSEICSELQALDENNLESSRKSERKSRANRFRKGKGISLVNAKSK